MKKIYTIILAMAMIAMLTYGFNFSPENNANTQSVVFLNNNFSPKTLNSQSPMATTIFSQAFDGAWTIASTLSPAWSSVGTGNNEWHMNTYTTGWTSVNGAYSPVGANSTTQSARFHTYDAVNGTTGDLITPNLDFSTYPNLKLLQFYYINTTGTDVLKIYLSTDGGSTWGASLLNLATASTWTLQSVSIGVVTSATVKIKFTATSDFGTTDIGVDQVAIYDVSPLTGIKTIKSSGGDYSSFSAAINDLNISGVGTGGVTFNVDPGFTITELCPIITATGTSGNPIVFQKNGAGTNPKITAGTGVGAVDGIIRINGGDYITFDGIDVSENASNLTTTTQMEYGYYIYNASATNGAQYNTIKNCKITLNRTNTSSLGIYQNVATTPTNATGANSNNKYYNITVENAFSGIYLLGNATYPDLSCEIGTTGTGQTTIGAATANDIGNGSGTLYGIRAVQQQNVKIFSCEVRNVTGTGTASNYHGIFLDGLKGTTNAVYLNNIHDIKGSSTSNGATISGIRADVAAGVIVNIYNNFISGITHASTTASSTQYVRGLACNVAGGTGTVNAYYNSIRIETSQYVSSTAFFSQIGTANTVDNIFSNYSATNATSKRYCSYISSGTLTTSNYNDYFINTAGTGNNVGYYSAADRNTLALWQTATSKDANSVSVDPSFASATDLHASASGIDAKGTPITTAGGYAVDVLTDIDGTTRNATTPDIGADEFVAGVDNPASFSATTNSDTQINLLVSANAGGNNIVVIFNGTGTFTAPTNGSAPTAVGTTLAGSGGTIVYYGLAGSLTNHTGLTANTPYYYKVFSYDGSNIYSTGIITNATTAKIEPTNQVTNFSKGTVTTTAIPLTWTAAATGSQLPDGYLVKLNTSSVLDPIDGTDPADILAITSGAANKKVTPGTAASTTSFTSMTAGTMYNYKIYSYTNTGSLINFNTTSAPTLSAATLPNPVTAGTLSATGTTTANISWSAATGYNSTNHSTLVFVKSTSAVTTGTPSNAPSTYTANTVFNSGTVYQNDASAYCVYNGDGNSVSITGLSASTTYYVLIYTVVDASNSDLTNSYSSGVTTNGSTFCPNSTLPISQGFNALTIPGCWSTQNVVGTSAIQFVASSSNPTTIPQEGTDYVWWSSFVSGWTAGNETRLVSPPITTTGTTSVDVNFYWYNENSTSYNSGAYLNEGVQVQYSLDGTTWTNAGSLFARYDGTLASGTGQWKSKSVTIAAAGNQATVYIGFKFHSEFGDNCSMDNIVIQASPIATNYYYSGTGSLASTSSWGANSNGTGTPPTDFTSPAQTFYIQNVTSITLDANWSVSGNNSKVVIGDGTNPCTFIIPAGFSYSGNSIIVNNIAELDIANTTIPSITPNAGSTVSFIGASAQTVPTLTYTNLVIYNSAGASISSATSVSGTLTLASGIFTNSTYLTMGNGATISRSGGSLSAVPTFTTSLNLIYTGSSAITTGKEVPPSSGTVLNNLTNSNSNTVTLGSDMAVNGSFALNAGTFAVSTFTLNLNGAITDALIRKTGNETDKMMISKQTNAKIQTDATNKKIVNKQNKSDIITDSPTSGGLLTSAEAGTVKYNSASNGQNVIAGDYGNLTFNNNNKNLPAGNINIAGTFTPGTGTPSTSGNTITFNGTGSQTVPTFAYNNLTINKPGQTATLGGDVTTTGDLTITAGTMNSIGSVYNTTNIVTDNFPTFPGSSWTGNTGTSGNDVFYSSATALAGGSSPEVTYVGSSQTSITKSIQSSFSTTGYSALNLSFKHKLHYYSTSYSYTCSFQYSTNGASWSTLYTVTTPNADVGPQTLSYTNLTTNGSSTCYVRFIVTGVPFGMFYWNIDDLIVDGYSAANNQYNITCGGNFVNNGIFSSGTGTMTFNGNGKTISGSTATSFYNLTNSGTYSLNSNSPSVSNILNMSSGTFGIGANTLTLNGTITGTGTLTGSTNSNLAISGNSAFGTLNFTSGSTDLNNFSLNRASSGTVTLGSDLNIAGSTTLSAGALIIGSNTLALNGPLSGSGTITGGSTSNLSIGGSGALTTLNFTSGSSTLNNLTINRTNALMSLKKKSLLNDKANTVDKYILAKIEKELSIIGDAPTIAGSVTLNQDLTVLGAATFTAGLVDPSTFNFTLGGTLSSAGGQVASNGTVTFANSMTIPDQLFVSNTANNITVNKTSGILTLGSDLNIIGLLTLTNGKLVTTDTYKLYFTNTALAPIESKNTAYIDGTAVMNLKGVGIGGIDFLKVYIAGGEDIGNVTIIRKTGPIGVITFGSNPTIACNWDINVSNQPATTGRDVTYSWWSALDNNKLFGSGNLAEIWTSTDNNVTWTQFGTGIDVSTSNPRSFAITSVKHFSSWVVSSQDAPLPVVIESFLSKIAGRDITLNWSTSMEHNNSGFDVERKAEGSSQWAKVGFVKGKGSTNSPANYTFDDKKLNSGKYNYRLKQIDFNGNFEYHTLNTVVDVALPTKFNLSQNYPNPFNPTTKIDFDLPFDSKVNIVLYDMTGREVKTLVNESRTAGFHTVQFNASDLSSGTYFYRIMTKSSGKDFVATKKMVLVK